MKEYAHALGFFRVGVARAETLETSRLDEWLSRGYHGEMKYMQDRREMRLDPSALVPNARSIIVCAMNYFTPFAATNKPDEGRISRYAWGDDYHDILRMRLQKLFAFIQHENPKASGRVFVDSAPMMEKEWAVRAGIGWLGKHTNVITRDYGSWFFLGEVILDVEFEYDEPFRKDYCGACTACINACPTGAIVEPRLLDARKCISYLTIELKNDSLYPETKKPQVGNHIFGCDVCQDVCPWNKRFAQPTQEPAFQPRPYNLSPKLADLEKMNADEFREKYRKSPIKRVRFAGFKRNVNVALENCFNPSVSKP